MARGAGGAGGEQRLGDALSVVRDPVADCTVRSDIKRCWRCS